MRWIIGLSAIIITLYTLALNPQTTVFNWNPAAEPLTIPVYLIIIATFAFGYLIGALYLWFSQLPKQLEHKKTRKQQEKTIKKLEQELENHEQNTPTDLLRD